MKKILRSKLFKAMFIIVLTVTLFLFQNYVSDQISGIEARTKVLVVKSNLVSKHKITKADIGSIDIPITDVPVNSIKNTDDVIGNFLIEPLSKGDFILTSNISESKNYETQTVPEGYKIISLSLNIDNAAGWLIEKEQIIELIYSPRDYRNEMETVNMDELQVELYNTRIISDVSVVDILNEALVSSDDEMFAGTPKFIVILLKEEDAEFIAYAKDKGRFDVLVTN